MKNITPPSARKMTREIALLGIFGAALVGIVALTPADEPSARDNANGAVAADGPVPTP